MRDKVKKSHREREARGVGSKKDNDSNKVVWVGGWVEAGAEIRGE